MRRTAILAFALFFTPVSVWASACTNLCPTQSAPRAAAQKHCCSRDETSGTPACHRQEGAKSQHSQSPVAQELCQLKPNVAPGSVQIDPPVLSFQWQALAVVPEISLTAFSLVAGTPETLQRAGPQPPSLSTIPLTL